MVSRQMLLVSVFLIGGCAAASVDHPPSPDHPASVDAPEAPYAPSPGVLAEDRTIPPPPAASQPESPATGHEQHGKSAQPAPSAATGADTTGQPPTTQPQEAAATYICPMHADVVSKAPGKCPKCGMTLVSKSSSGTITPHQGEHHE